MVPEIWSATDRIFCHFGLFFASTNTPENQNFEKMKKMCGELSFYMCAITDKTKFWKNEKNTYTHVYQKSWSYATLFLIYDAWRMQF